MTRGAVWMALFEFIERSIGLVSTLVLVMVLLPAGRAAIMLAGVRSLIPDQSVAMQVTSALAVLLGLVMFGGHLYAFSLFVLRRLAGRRLGAEQWAVERLGQALSRRSRLGGS